MPASKQQDLHFCLVSESRARVRILYKYPRMKKLDLDYDLEYVRKWLSGTWRIVTAVE